MLLALTVPPALDGWQGPVSDHFDGRQFHNLEPIGLGFCEWVKRRFTTHHGPWRKFTDTPPGPPPPERIARGPLHVTLVNHDTLLIQMDGVNVLTDPIWSERSAPVVGSHRHRPPGLRFEDLPHIDAVLVSHNHHDHMDLPTLSRLAARDHPKIVVGLGNTAFLGGKGIGGGHDLDWWQSVEIAPGVAVTAVPARHMSGRGPFDQNQTLWCGFVLAGPSGSVYFAGDTGIGSHFAAIGKRFPHLTLALLPIGGFKPLWYMREQHLGPADALAAFRELGAETMIPMHFGTFVEGDDGELEPVETLCAAVAQAPPPVPRVVILDNGESADLPPAPEAPERRGRLACSVH